MANKRNTVLYIGVTNNLSRRVSEHKDKVVNSFSSKYNCTKLVWFIETQNIKSAIYKEKQMKKWKREFKNNIINELNPDWIDLADRLI